MPNKKEHCYMTQNAVKLTGKKFPEGLWQDYCCYPDMYFSEPEKVKKYYFGTDGIQFHYPPTTDYAALYRYWDVKDGKLVSYPFRNENYRHMIRGFNYYIRQTLRETEAECWKYAGCIVHTLEDSLFGVHPLENAGGFDLQALDRLGYFNTNPAELICKCDPATCFAEITDYRPQVLGRNAEEFALNLYSRYVFLGNNSRSAAFRTIMAIHEKNDEKTARQCIASCFRNAVTLSADVLYTLHLLREKKAAKEFTPISSLTDVMPVSFPFGGGSTVYRFSSYTTNFAYDKKREKVPLSLWSGNRKLTFARGFAFGVHVSREMLFRLPVRGYKSFTAKIGLLPDGDPCDGVKINLINAGKTIQRSEFQGMGEMQTIQIDRPRGWFGLKMTSNSAKGIFVIGDPVLLS